ncbi:FecR family protein [Sunxiuqinia sp. A32]|uniref:FecR family protein n=1 Tax=Sunxiuqinia sp. A32 TaxID=3461496 RepID=UPI004045C2B6
MDEKKKYWEGLVSNIHNETDKSENLENEKWPTSDYHWALGIKDQLARVFLWDQYNRNEAKVRLDYRLQHKENRLVRFSRLLWVRAAVILIAIFSGAILHSLIPDTIEGTRYTEVVVPLGQMSQIKLSDGTSIWLNSGSVLKYPNEFELNKREVFLDGEAFMEVAKNKKKPFVVNANDFDVEVLGTSFNISSYSTDEYAIVTLVEGKVRLHSEKNHWKRNIVPGQSATMAGGEIQEIEDVNTDFYTSWKEGKIVFRKESLEEIAKRMERWYNVDIQFENEQLKKLQFSGTFLKYKPVEQVFRSLSIMSQKMDFVSINRVDQKNIIKIIEKN